MVVLLEPRCQKRASERCSRRFFLSCLPASVLQPNSSSSRATLLDRVAIPHGGRERDIVIAEGREKLGTRDPQFSLPTRLYLRCEKYTVRCIRICIPRA